MLIPKPYRQPEDNAMKKCLAISFIVLLILAACAPSQADIDSAVQTAIAGTQAIEDAFATLVAETAAAIPPTPTPTETPLPPPLEPTALAKTNTNCRSGPASTFENIVLLQQGEGGKIIGLNTTSITPWYKLELADGRQCWASVETLDISGDTSGLRQITSPPTPTSLPPYYGTWTVWFRDNYYTTSGYTQATMNCTGAGTNLTCSFLVGGCQYAVNGTSSDGLIMLGKLTNSCKPSYEWELRWIKISDNQFGGSWYWHTDSTFDGDWCGARPGGSKPDPCKR